MVSQSWVLVHILPNVPHSCYKKSETLQAKSKVSLNGLYRIQEIMVTLKAYSNELLINSNVVELRTNLVIWASNSVVTGCI